MKSLLAITLSFALVGPSLGQIDIGKPVRTTSYDRYMSPVMKVFATLGTVSPPVDDVRRLLRSARRFDYYFNKSSPYVPQSPEVTDATHRGDCKAKSLWLLNEMKDASATRFVIGRTDPQAKINHAWLLWKHSGKWWILDPTTKTSLVSAQKTNGRRWLAWYSWSKGAKYKHTSYDRYF